MSTTTERVALRAFLELAEAWTPGAPHDYPRESFAGIAIELLEGLHAAHLELPLIRRLDRNGRLTRARARRIVRRTPPIR